MRDQRDRISRALTRMPGLRPCLDDREWLHDAWEDAVRWASGETGIDEFPEQLIWTVNQILDPAFFPD